MIHGIAKTQSSAIETWRVARSPAARNPVYVGGKDVNNDTHAKLGPNDNDTPLINTPDGPVPSAVSTASNPLRRSAFVPKVPCSTWRILQSPLTELCQKVSQALASTPRREPE